MSVLPLSPVMTMLGGTALIAGGAGATMAVAGDDGAQKIRQGATVIGGIGGSLAIASTMFGPSTGTWAKGTGKLTGMTKPGQAAYLGLTVLAGVAALNILSELNVAGPDKGSFIGGF